MNEKPSVMRNSGEGRVGRRGAALMMALFLTVFLFVLGLSLLYFLDQDSRFGLEMQRSQQAQTLARSGIYFARNEEVKSSPGGIPAPTNAPLGYYEYYTDPVQTQGFRIWKDTDANRTVHVLGLVRDSSGKVLASRQLATSTLDPLKMHLRYWDVDL